MKLRITSLKSKLILVSLMTSFVALLLAFSGITLYEYRVFREQIVADLTTQAQIVGSNSTAALRFRDPFAAKEVLAALKGTPEVTAAALYTPDHNLFATFLPQR